MPANNTARHRRWFTGTGLAVVITAALVVLGVAACGTSTAASSSGSSGAGGGASSKADGTSGVYTHGTGTSMTAYAHGKQVFENSGCGGCHTLAAAGSSGSIGPDLDQLKPSYAAVVRQVDHGGGGMPAFASSLSTAQIKAVATFVATAARAASN